MADEIYDNITYDGAKFEPLAPLAGDLPCLSFGGLSKVHRACGWRIGWAVLSRRGDAPAATTTTRIDLLGALRLCANVPGQFAVPAALRAPTPSRRSASPAAVCTRRARRGRRPARQANTCRWCCRRARCMPSRPWWAMPRSAFDDHVFALELLEVEGVLVVPGSSFNVQYRNHFRVTLLPEAGTMGEVFRRIDRCSSVTRTPGADAGRRRRLSRRAHGPDASDAGRRQWTSSPSVIPTPSAKASRTSSAGRCNWPRRCAHAASPIAASAHHRQERLDHRRTVWPPSTPRSARQTEPPYDLVSLQIGVNNQYRGRSVEEYRAEFCGCSTARSPSPAASRRTCWCCRFPTGA